MGSLVSEAEELDLEIIAMVSQETLCWHRAVCPHPCFCLVGLVLLISQGLQWQLSVHCSARHSCESTAAVTGTAVVVWTSRESAWTDNPAVSSCPS